MYQSMPLFVEGGPRDRFLSYLNTAITLTFSFSFSFSAIFFPLSYFFSLRISFLQTHPIFSHNGCCRCSCYTWFHLLSSSSRANPHPETKGTFFVYNLPLLRWIVLTYFFYLLLDCKVVRFLQVPWPQSPHFRVHPESTRRYESSCKKPLFERVNDDFNLTYYCNRRNGSLNVAYFSAPPPTSDMTFVSARQSRLVQQAAGRKSRKPRKSKKKKQAQLYGVPGSS
jgi:hypothetical protein